LARLLFDDTGRADLMHRQAAYLNQVRALPTGAQLITHILGD
jgi:hypothetical protein